MKTAGILSLGLAVGITVWGGTAFGQTKADKCPKTPEKLEAQVIKINPEQGKVTVREADGTTHELQASKETLQGYKVGDRIEAKLRSAPECK